MKLPHGAGHVAGLLDDAGSRCCGRGRREDTRDGGMEFDILEYLSRYGPYRYNIACHWDGYEKDHKSTGTDQIYVQPDKEGFLPPGCCGSLEA